MMYPPRGSNDFGAKDNCDNENIEAFIEEVMAINEEVDIEELDVESLPSNKPTLELKPLPYLHEYVFLDACHKI